MHKIMHKEKPAIEVKETPLIDYKNSLNQRAFLIEMRKNF